MSKPKYIKCGECIAFYDGDCGDCGECRLGQSLSTYEPICEISVKGEVGQCRRMSKPSIGWPVVDTKTCGCCDGGAK